MQTIHKAKTILSINDEMSEQNRGHQNGAILGDMSSPHAIRGDRIRMHVRQCCMSRSSADVVEELRSEELGEELFPCIR